MNLSTELIQNILNYLANRPYAEVFQLINAVQTEVAKMTNGGAGNAGGGADVPKEE